MKKAGESAVRRRRGSRISQAEGPFFDDALESKVAPKKQSAQAGNLSGTIQRQGIHPGVSLPLFFIFLAPRSLSIKPMESGEKRNLYVYGTENTPV